MKGPVFIVNSRAKPQQIAAFTRAILTHIAHKQHEVFFTEYAGHAEVLAQQAVEKQAEMIIAVGGDGTVNEVLQGIGLSGIPLGIIPLGSGNGLARHVGIPIDIISAMQMIAEGEIQRVDIGQANTFYFISNCGFGFDALVTQKIKDSRQRGLSMYVKESFRNFFSYVPQQFTLTIAGETFTREAFMVNVANGSEFGYGFTIAPQAGMQDGMLDVMIVKPFPWYKSFRLMSDAWMKKWDTNPLCEHHKASEIHITATQNLNLQTDGDARTCGATCTILVHPKALNLLVPKGQKNL